MALGRKAAGSRRVVLVGTDGTGTIIADPAIDQALSNPSRYYESLFDERHLVFLPGEEPTWWTIRPLSKRQKDAASGYDTPRRLAEWYIRCGLLAHTTWTIEDDAGAIRPGPQPDRRDQGRLGEYASEEWYEAMDLPAVIASALFGMIALLSEAQRPLSKPS